MLRAVKKMTFGYNECPVLNLQEQYRLNWSMRRLEKTIQAMNTPPIVMTNVTTPVVHEIASHKPWVFAQSKADTMLVIAGAVLLQAVCSNNYKSPY